LIYGTVPFDDFCFTVGSDGLAKSVNLKVLRSILQRA